MQWDYLVLPSIYSIKIHTKTPHFFAESDWNWFTESWRCLFSCGTLLEDQHPPKNGSFLPLNSVEGLPVPVWIILIWICLQTHEHNETLCMNMIN